MLIVPRLLQDFARDQRVKSRKSDLYFTPHVPCGYIQNLVICRQKSANYFIANFQAETISNIHLTLQYNSVTFWTSLIHWPGNYTLSRVLYKKKKKIKIRIFFN